MNLNTMMQVRHQIWQSFTQSRDALFELADALTSVAGARSLPELSLSASFLRKWSSGDFALEDGRIDTQRWSTIWTQALLANHEGPVWMSVDATSIPRPEAETSPDRGIIYVCNLPHESRPVSVGWQFSTVMLLPDRRSSWGAILSQKRKSLQQTAVSVAVSQVEQLRPLLPHWVRILADRCYATGAFLLACQRMQVEVLLHILRNRKLYRPATRPTKGKRRAPCKDGTLFQGSRPETWGEPEQEWKGTDEHGHPVTVQAWHRLHLRQAREVEVSVYRVLREHARGTKRDPRESWFCFQGLAPLPLEEVVSTHRHRFSHEHTYRFRHRKISSGRKHGCARLSSLNGGACWWQRP